MFKKRDTNTEFDEQVLKQAFQNIKFDINNLKNDIFNIKEQLNILTNLLNNQKNTSTHTQKDSTDFDTSTDTSTHNLAFQDLKAPFSQFSSGNEGVSTDRQTLRQTDRHIQNDQKTIKQSISEASEIIESFDNIKQELKQKFQQITTQEMLVFSTIYQLEEQGDQDIDYKKLAQKLSLSQSSIRDYVQRLINKGISIQKARINNKKIRLNISPELKKIASLNTILSLKEQTNSNFF